VKKYIFGGLLFLLTVLVSLRIILYTPALHPELHMSEGKTATLTSVIHFEKVFRESANRISLLENELAELSEKAKAIVREADDRKFQSEIRELEEMILVTEDEDSKIEIKKLIEDKREWRAEMANLSNTTEQLARDGLQLLDMSVAHKLRDTIVISQNKHSLVRALSDPNEVMARVVQSLYSLYFGEPKPNLYPLSSHDLEFLGKFHYAGKPLFGKGVEKYKLAMMMIDAGIPPKDVRANLAFATSFVWEGKVYEFPDSAIEIHGVPSYME